MTLWQDFAWIHVCGGENQGLEAQDLGAWTVQGRNYVHRKLYHLKVPAPAETLPTLTTSWHISIENVLTPHHCQQPHGV